MESDLNKSIFVTGAAGLVGQNLIPKLKSSSSWNIVAVDKHPTNTIKLRELHPEIEVIHADLSKPGDWQEKMSACDYSILLHAQIGGLNEAEFHTNNIIATEHCLDAISSGKTEYLVHISSSVVNSMADDFYTRSKTQQEKLVATLDVPHVILRPTLMFGWFDRKHMGWLRRFMRSAPVFPIPGNGMYLRQPLYAGDFSSIIRSCLTQKTEGAYNISGQDRIDYIDLIKTMKKVTGETTPVVKIPYWLFAGLLRTYALFDRNPPFTVNQLKALVTPDIFEVIDWPKIFGVPATPLSQAMEETFLDPTYSNIVLDF